MIDPHHLLHYVIRPVLRDLQLWTNDAERLLLGTACQESECGTWVVQIGGGPALGIYQMETATHDDLWATYIQHREPLANKVNYWRGRWGNGFGAQEMIGNLYYATAMCRIKYLRDPETIPDNLRGQAQLWKRVYNTELGQGTVDEYMNSWNRFVPSGMI